MPVIPVIRVIPVQDCLLLSVILNHLAYFSCSMVLSVMFSSVTIQMSSCLCCQGSLSKSMM